MAKPLVVVNNLSVSVADKIVVAGLDMSIRQGEVVALMGANGSGKSSFAQTIMGNPLYVVGRASSVTIDGDDLLQMSSDERARAKIFVAWQNPVSIPGVSVFSLCKSSYEAQGGTISKLTDFKKYLETLAERVGLNIEHITRSLNDGFSGGEKKRMELLQLLLLEPKIAILDEIDSGLDVDGLKMVGTIVNEMQKRGTSFVLITHYKKLLDYVKIDKIYVMESGKIVKSGGMELAQEIEEIGYGRLSTRI